MPLGSKTAILLALRSPAYGLQIVDRISRRSGGRIRLGLGSVYPALRDLQRRRILRSWVVPAARGGRPRRYYELTPKGVAAGAAEERLLVALLGGENDDPKPPDVRGMRERLRECARLSGFVLDLRRRMVEGGEGRA
jgi:PadR family transcriptional regulator PadR